MGMFNDQPYSLSDQDSDSIDMTVLLRDLSHRATCRGTGAMSMANIDGNRKPYVWRDPNASSLRKAIRNACEVDA